MQGDEDHLVPDDRSEEFARLTGAELVTYEGVGHLPNARHPVRFNHLVRDFSERAYERPKPPIALAPGADASTAGAVRLVAHRARPRLA